VPARSAWKVYVAVLPGVAPVVWSAAERPAVKAEAG
jgi:hypothetical protein